MLEDLVFATLMLLYCTLIYGMGWAEFPPQLRRLMGCLFLQGLAPLLLYFVPTLFHLCSGPLRFNRVFYTYWTIALSIYAMLHAGNAAVHCGWALLRLDGRGALRHGAQLWYWTRRAVEGITLNGMCEFLRLFTVSLRTPDSLAALLVLPPLAELAFALLTIVFLINTYLFPLERPPE